MTTHESWVANVIQQPKETTSSSSWWFNIRTHKATWKQSLQPCRKHHAVAAGTWVGICHAQCFLPLDEHLWTGHLSGSSTPCKRPTRGSAGKPKFTGVHSWVMRNGRHSHLHYLNNALHHLKHLDPYLLHIISSFVQFLWFVAPFLGLAVMHDIYLHWTNIILYIVKYHS